MKFTFSHVFIQFRSLVTISILQKRCLCFFQIHYQQILDKKKKRYVTSGTEAKERSSFTKVFPENAYNDSLGNEVLYSPQHTSSTTRLVLEKILICKTLHNFEEGGFSNRGFPSTTWLVYLTQQILSLVRHQKREKFLHIPPVIIYWISTTTFRLFKMK